VWEKDAADDAEAAKLDTDELEALFGTKRAAEPKEADESEKRKSAPKVELVALVDPKRAQAISTVIGNLRSMKLDTDTVVSALLTADLRKLENPRMPVEMVLTLISNSMPTAEEAEQLEAFDGARETLRDVEKFLLVIKEQLPHYEQRANALVARAAFANAHAEEAGVLRRVHDTAKQIRESRTLRQLLALTLALGNYLNGTSRQGGAYGFKLSALSELQSCKSSDAQMTLLHYLAKKTAVGAPDGGSLLALLRTELPALDDPVRFEWASSTAEMAKLAKSIKAMGALVEKDSVAEFKTNMSEFLSDAQKNISELESLTKDTTGLCVDLGTWFSEAKVDKEPEKFFAMVGGFVKALELAEKFNREAKEREEKKRQRALQAAKEAEARKNAPKTAGGRPLSDKSNHGDKELSSRLRATGGDRKNLVDNVVAGMAQGRVRRHG